MTIAKCPAGLTEGNGALRQVPGWMFFCAVSDRLHRGVAGLMGSMEKLLQSTLMESLLPMTNFHPIGTASDHECPCNTTVLAFSC